MAAPVQDFARVLSGLIRFAKGASYTLIVLLGLFLAFRIAELWRFFHGLHPLAGAAFLIAVVLALYFFIGRPVMRFLEMPRAMRPPALPPEAERQPQHVAAHLQFVERYVAHLPENPHWQGDEAAVANAIAAAQALREEAALLDQEGVAAFAPRLKELERRHVQPLLAPLDKQAREIIRQEALATGVATAVSWNGTMDAFLVLWRSCNLASRIARIYYGRPGVRGTLSILRDVSAATLASAYLQDLTQMAGGTIGGAFGKTVGAVAGPLLEGGLNAVAMLRIGYLTQARCRSFQAWTEQGRVAAVRGALREAGLHTKEIVTEVIRTVGGGILDLPGRVLGKVTETLSALWRTPETGGT